MSKTFGEKSRLMNAIIEHNFVSQMVVKFNQLLKYMVFILYFVAAPSIEILLYFMFDKKSMIIFRWSCFYCFVVLFSGVSLMVYLCSRMTESSHQSYRILFNIIDNKRIKLTIREKWKVLSFIETLSGDLTLDSIVWICFQ